MVDVGAHSGTSFRPYLEQGWRVLAFEPDSTKHAKLSRFIGRPGYTFLPFAVGDQPSAAVQFFTSPESTGISSLVPFRSSHTPADQVPVTTLAAELAAANIKAVDYLKVDTEGYDLAVLRGHDWRVKPDVLMCEFDEVKTRILGHDYRSLGDLLLDQGYAVWLSQWVPLERYGSGHTWNSIGPYPGPLHTADAWGNFIAVRQDSAVHTMRDLVSTHLDSA